MCDWRLLTSRTYRWLFIHFYFLTDRALLPFSRFLFLSFFSLPDLNQVTGTSFVTWTNVWVIPNIQYTLGCWTFRVRFLTSVVVERVAILFRLSENNYHLYYFPPKPPGINCAKRELKANHRVWQVQKKCIREALWRHEGLSEVLEGDSIYLTAI